MLGNEDRATQLSLFECSAAERAHELGWVSIRSTSAPLCVAACRRDMRSGGFHRQYNAAGLDLRRRKTSRRPITKLQPGKGCLGTGDAVGGRRAAVSQGRTSALGGTQSPAGWVVCCGLTVRRNRSSNRCARRRCAGRTGANPRRRSHSAFRPSCDASCSTHAGRPCGAAGTPCRRSSFAADCPTARLRPVEVGGNSRAFR